MLAQCWTSVADDGPMLSQYWFLGHPYGVQTSCHWCEHVPSRHDALTQCLFTVGPPSMTSGQQWNSIGSTFRVCLVPPCPRVAALADLDAVHWVTRRVLTAAPSHFTRWHDPPFPINTPWRRHQSLFPLQRRRNSGALDGHMAVSIQPSAS